MQIIDIRDIKDKTVLNQWNTVLDGTISEDWGEKILDFENDKGEGHIRSISFDWGVTLIDYDVTFSDDTKVVFHLDNISPIEFIFVSEGKVIHHNHKDEKNELERYQNIIISAKKGTKESFTFCKNVKTRINFIYILRSEYAQKKNHNIPSLKTTLKETFNDTKASELYQHSGNFSLKIADQIKKLNENNAEGMVRTLSIEGQLNMIMAMQITEQTHFEQRDAIPESLSKKDLKKIHELSGYILDNIEDPLTIDILSNYTGLSHRKLQLGFNVLYSKSVNEYIRQIKLELARDYLKNSDKNISEIVYAIGFKSRSYFSKVFFEYYNILPSDYRKKVRNIKSKLKSR